MMRKKSSAQKTIRDIRRATRRHCSAEEKIRIVLEGLRVEDTIAELCRREGLNSNVYYRWSKEFMEAGKKRLAGDTAREVTSDEVKQLLGVDYDADPSRRLCFLLEKLHYRPLYYQFQLSPRTNPFLRGTRIHVSRAGAHKT